LNKKMSVYEGRLAFVELKSTMPPGHADDVKQLLDTLEWRSKPTDTTEDYEGT